MQAQLERLNQQLEDALSSSTESELVCVWSVLPMRAQSPFLTQRSFLGQPSFNPVANASNSPYLNQLYELKVKLDNAYQGSLFGITANYKCHRIWLETYPSMLDQFNKVPINIEPIADSPPKSAEDTIERYKTSLYRKLLSVVEYYCEITNWLMIKWQRHDSPKFAKTCEKWRAQWQRDSEKTVRLEALWQTDALVWLELKTHLTPYLIEGYQPIQLFSYAGFIESFRPFPRPLELDKVWVNWVQPVMEPWQEKILIALRKSRAQLTRRFNSLVQHDEQLDVEWYSGKLLSYRQELTRLQTAFNTRREELQGSLPSAECSPLARIYRRKLLRAIANTEDWFTHRYSRINELVSKLEQLHEIVEAIVKDQDEGIPVTLQGVNRQAFFETQCRIRCDALDRFAVAMEQTLANFAYEKNRERFLWLVRQRLNIKPKSTFIYTRWPSVADYVKQQKQQQRDRVVMRSEISPMFWFIQNISRCMNNAMTEYEATNCNAEEEPPQRQLALSLEEEILTYQACYDMNDFVEHYHKAMVTLFRAVKTISNHLSAEEAGNKLVTLSAFIEQDSMLHSLFKKLSLKYHEDKLIHKQISSACQQEVLRYYTHISNYYNEWQDIMKQVAKYYIEVNSELKKTWFGIWLLMLYRKYYEKYKKLYHQHKDCISELAKFKIQAQEGIQICRQSEKHKKTIAEKDALLEEKAKLIESKQRRLILLQAQNCFYKNKENSQLLTFHILACIPEDLTFYCNSYLFLTNNPGSLMFYKIDEQGSVNAVPLENVLRCLEELKQHFGEDDFSKCIARSIAQPILEKYVLTPQSNSTYLLLSSKKQAAVSHVLNEEMTEEGEISFTYE